MQPEQIDNVAITVIRAAKSENPPYTFQELRAVLKEHYSPKMTMQDVIYILCEVFDKALKDKRLKISFGPEKHSKLLLAPLNMLLTENMTKLSLTEVNLQTAITIETMYNNFIHNIISILRMCNRSEAPELADEPEEAQTS